MNEARRVELQGIYAERASGHVSSHWERACADHEQEFPQIRSCSPGTFNIQLNAEYLPPGEADYRAKSKKRFCDSNHISPRAKVVEINGQRVEAWIYRGGHPNTVLELISAEPLARLLGAKNGCPLKVVISEVPEGTALMPSPPP